MVVLTSGLRTHQLRDDNRLQTVEIGEMRILGITRVGYHHNESSSMYARNVRYESHSRYNSARSSRDTHRDDYTPSNDYHKQPRRSEFDDDLHRAFNALLNNRCSTTKLKKNEERIPRVYETFYDNMVNYLEKFDGVKLKEKLADKDNEDETREFMSNMFHVAVIGALAGKYVFHQNIGFEKSCRQRYEGLNLTNDMVKRLSFSMYSMAGRSDLFCLPKTYKVTNYRRSEPSRQKSPRDNDYNTHQSTRHDYNYGQQPAAINGANVHSVHTQSTSTVPDVSSSQQHQPIASYYTQQQYDAYYSNGQFAHYPVSNECLYNYSTAPQQQQDNTIAGSDGSKTGHY